MQPEYEDVAKADSANDSKETIRGEQTKADDEVIALRGQNENKSLEDLIRSLQPTIASLEATIKSTYGGTRPLPEQMRNTNANLCYFC